jgi:hypothetical protein
VYDFPGRRRIRLLFGHPSRFVVVGERGVCWAASWNVTHFLVHIGFHLQPVVPASFLRLTRIVSQLQPEGLFQWRNYEPWLDSLKDALGDALIRYRD